MQVRRNFTVVQALRGLAALWVVLFHAAGGGHIAALQAVLPATLNAVVFTAGHLGVAVFFGLSGFVIAHSLADAEPDPGFFWRFVVRRSLRLDPAYWVSIAIVIALSALSATVRSEAWNAPSLTSITAHLFYLQEILGTEQLNPVYWTLTYEVQFYVFFVAVMVVLRPLGLRYKAAAWSVFYAVAFMGVLGLFDAAPRGLFMKLWPAFFVGALAYRATTHRLDRYALAALIALLVGRSYLGGRPEADMLTLVSAATAIFLYAAKRTGWIYKGLDWTVLQFSGLISYSLYLLHNPVSGATAFIVHRIVGTGVLADMLTLAAILAASLGAATLLWLAVERPSHRWSKRLHLKPKVQTAWSHTATLS